MNYIEKRINWFSSLPNNYRKVIIDKIKENNIDLEGDNYYQIFIRGINY